MTNDTKNILRDIQQILCPTCYSKIQLLLNESKHTKNEGDPYGCVKCGETRYYHIDTGDGFQNYCPKCKRTNWFAKIVKD